MRCATLADALRSRGATVTFVCRDLPGNYIAWLEARNFEVVKLAAPLPLASAVHGAYLPVHLPWLGVSLDQEIAEVRRALADLPLQDWIIVDHYALDQQWERQVQPFTRSIMVIDDLADRRHDCNVLLDQNYYRDMQQRYDNLLPPSCKKLLGPAYALLRDEFASRRAGLKPRSGAVERVLVFFGGVDADNYTGATIAALAGADRPQVQVDVVIGAGHPARAAIEAACERYGYSCHVQTPRMAELMAGADLAIGAGGTATWERCCLGLPALTLCIADNQRQLVDDAALAGLIYAPQIDQRHSMEQGLRQHYLALLDNQGLRGFLSQQSHDVVDGRGAARVARAMGSHGIVLRQAQVADSADLMAWRNHPSIRAVSRNSAPIMADQHQAWFDAVLRDEQRILLIGQHADGQAVGVVRFDLHEDSAEVSIYLVPGASGRGLGAELLASAEQWLSKNRSDITIIRAEVLGDNQPSHRLFLTGSYVRDSTRYFKKVN
ncbi:acetyltransferase family protein [Janthinobacterium agaricidamnosum NBRC 102515 = DSM 9628]|uniref:Acetyltransferase family protein n=2 Tax=Janthinobacterium agaricidamnosum TaxID=55508 RepID=W0V143_9BURK|nr:acetyltransferase family protein [Janthinobacterium agaricidamnosum NBRC 102515 = DSM 9628]